MSNLFQIYENDLAMLEQVLPVLQDAVMLSPAHGQPRVQVALEEAKRIVSDVRWNYGPHPAVKVVTLDPPSEPDID